MEAGRGDAATATPLGDASNAGDDAPSRLSSPPMTSPKTRPPWLAPLEHVLPEDFHRHRTDASLELMASLAPPAVKRTGARASKHERDVARWREEAGAVRDVLLRREADARAERAAAAGRLGDARANATPPRADDAAASSASAASDASARGRASRPESSLASDGGDLLARVLAYAPETAGKSSERLAADAARRAARRAAAEKSSRDARARSDAAEKARRGDASLSGDKDPSRDPPRGFRGVFARLASAVRAATGTTSAASRRAASPKPQNPK